MSSTNKTATIELSQYIGTDKPTYLSDYNGDMLKIDNAIAEDRDSIATAQSTADSASSKADTNTQLINTLNETVNGSGTGLATRLTNLEGTVNNISSLIGNGEPTTTDKTIIGAINEIQAEVEAITPGGSVSAADVSYTNTTSGLNASNVQAAIDEVNNKVDNIVVPTSTVEKKSATLAAGSTSVTLTFTQQQIGATTFVDWYTSDPEVVPTSITTSTTTVVITFEAQANAITVGARVEN